MAQKFRITFRYFLIYSLADKKKERKVKPLKFTIGQQLLKYN